MTTSGSLRLLTDEQWARLGPCLPRNAGKTGRPFADHRRTIDGIIYRYRNGLPWRDLPREAFGPWQTVRHNGYQRMPRWLLSVDGRALMQAVRIGWALGEGYLVRGVRAPTESHLTCGECRRWCCE